jgi:hypothetical protein
MGDAEGHHAQKFLMPVPCFYFAKIIGTDDEVKTSSGKHLRKFFDGIERIGKALPPDFLFPDFKRRLSGHRKPKHGKTVTRRSSRTGLMGRSAGRDKKNAGESETIGGKCGKRQMTVVDRVKGPAQNTNGRVLFHAAGRRNLHCRIATLCSG